MINILVTHVRDAAKIKDLLKEALPRLSGRNFGKVFLENHWAYTGPSKKVADLMIIHDSTHVSESILRS